MNLNSQPIQITEGHNVEIASIDCSMEEFLQEGFCLHGVREALAGEPFNYEISQDRYYQITYERGRQFGLFLKHNGWTDSSKFLPTPHQLGIARIISTFSATDHDLLM